MELTVGGNLIRKQIIKFFDKDTYYERISKKLRFYAPYAWLIKID